MEKLYKISRTILMGCFFLSASNIVAQKDLMVFKTEGRPVMRVNDSLKSLSKGSLVVSNAVVSLKANENIILIDDDGNCFTASEAGDYAYSDLLGAPAASDNSSFTKKYFTYVWNQFTNNVGSKTKTGVVYRNDNIVLLQPSDSVRIHFPEIEFVWNIEAETSFFMLKEMNTGAITKFGVKGNSLVLFVDNNVLKKGYEYEWAVSDKKFPDLEDIIYYNFSLLSSDEFRALKPEIDVFKADLAKLGLSSDEVKVLLCSDYKICY